MFGSHDRDTGLDWVKGLVHFDEVKNLEYTRHCCSQQVTEVRSVSVGVPVLHDRMQLVGLLTSRVLIHQTRLVQRVSL